MARRTQFGSNLQDRKYRCKYCNNENTKFNAMASELSCKSCGSIVKVTAQELKELKIIQTGRKRLDTRKMSKVQKMKAMTHIQDTYQSDLSSCGIQKAGKFSEIKLTSDPKKATCEKCQWSN